jgi:prophage regulatory protein
MAIKKGVGSKQVIFELNTRIGELFRELEKLSKVGAEGWSEENGNMSEIPVPSNPGPKNVEEKLDRLLRLKEVLEYIPISKSSWWAGVKSGRYPAPVHHLGPRVTAWRYSEIMQLIVGKGASHA